MGSPASCESTTTAEKGRCVRRPSPDCSPSLPLRSGVVAFPEVDAVADVVDGDDAAPVNVSVVARGLASPIGVFIRLRLPQRMASRIITFACSGPANLLIRTMSRI